MRIEKGRGEGRGGRAEIDDPSSVPKVVPFQIVLKGPKQTTEAKRERITTTENSVAVELVTRHPNNFRSQEHEQPQDFFYTKMSQRLQL